MERKMASLAQLADRIRDIEDAFKATPDFYGNYVMQRAMMCACLQEVQQGLEEAGYENTTFATELAFALTLTDAGQRVGLFALPRDLRDSIPRDPALRFWVESTAAAILEIVSSDKTRTQLAWGDWIGRILADAGYRPPGRRGGAYTGSAIKKWRKDCIQGRHALTSNYEGILKRIRADGGPDAKRELKAYADVWAERLGKAKNAGREHWLAAIKRQMTVLWGASFEEGATIDDVRHVLDKMRESNKKRRGLRKPIVATKGKLGE